MTERDESKVIAELRRELSLSRCLAWAAHHRIWAYAWFPEDWVPGPEEEWRLPPWLSTSVEPDQQDWYVDPRAPRPAQPLAELIPEVTSVRVLHDYVVEVRFADGLVGEYDFAGKLSGPAFDPVRTDYATFCSIRLSPEGGTVAWPVGADPDQWPDWSPEELYQHVSPKSRATDS